MKVSTPFGIRGSLTLNASYAVGKTVRPFSISSWDAEDTADLAWGSSNEIAIVFAAKYEFMTLETGGLKIADFSKGNVGFIAKWTAGFSDDGIGLVPSGQPKIVGSNNYEGPVVVGVHPELSESGRSSKKPYVEMVLTVAVAQESDGGQFGLQRGPISVSGSLGSEKKGGARDLSLRLWLRTEQPRPKPAPKPIPKIPNQLLRPQPILYSEDEHYLPSKAVDALRKWANEVKDIPELAILISGSFVVIKLEAFASTTGTPQQNKKETDKRLEQVKKVIKDEFKSNTLFIGKSWGDKKADGKGPKNPRNRRVEIEIDGAAVNKLLKDMSER